MIPCSVNVNNFTDSSCCTHEKYIIRSSLLLQPSLLPPIKNKAKKGNVKIMTETNKFY